MSQSHLVTFEDFKTGLVELIEGMNNAAEESNPEVLEVQQGETVREGGSGLCDQHHFSSLSAATSQVGSNSLFSAIDPDNSGRAPIETVVDYLESANGLSGVYHILADTGGGLVLQV